MESRSKTSFVVARPGARSWRFAGGFTLIELMVAIAILGITLSLALPAFSDMMARNRLKSAAEQLRSDLNLARTEAQRRGQRVVVSFTRSSASTWCYGLTLNTTSFCDCTVTDTASASLCFLDAAVRRTVSGSDFSGVSLDAVPFSSGRLSFSPVRPSLPEGNASLSSTRETVRIEADDAGRIRICSPAGTSYLNHYPQC